MAIDLRYKTFFEDIYCATFNGISRFLGPVKLALAIRDRGQETKFSSFDATGLIAGHSIKSADLDKLLGGSHQSRWMNLRQDVWMFADPNAGGSALIWLIHRPSTLENMDPLEQWLSEATTLTRHASGNLPVDPQVARSACDTLLSFAPTAVKRASQAKTKSFRVINPIDVILNLTLTYEEGNKCSGNIIFHDTAHSATLPLILRLKAESRPFLTSTKHLRKLITGVESSDFYVVTDRTRAIGILESQSNSNEVTLLFDNSVRANLVRGHAEIFSGRSYLCSAYEGQLFLRALNSPAAVIEGSLRGDEMLSANQISGLTKIITNLVEYVRESSSGCSVVLDTDPEEKSLSGDYLEVPIDMTNPDGMEIAKRMATIDGALHIDSSGKLLGFGCLLDGRSLSNEDRARGARYNSALRFTKEHPLSLVITVSADGPISYFRNGIDMNRGHLPIVTEAQLVEVP